jgi:hypothetical protein
MLDRQVWSLLVRPYGGGCLPARADGLTRLMNCGSGTETRDLLDADTARSARRARPVLIESIESLLRSVSS